MDSEDSRDASGDAQSTSSSSSSSSRSRRSSSSDSSKKDPKSPPHSPTSPRYNRPKSPSPDSRSQTSERSTTTGKPPLSPDNLSEAHSDINSPENSIPPSPIDPKSPDGPKSPSEVGSNIGSPENPEQYSSAPPSGGEGPKTPHSPGSSLKSPPASPLQPVSPDSASQVTSPRNREPRSPSASPSPDRASFQSSPPRSPIKKNDWSPKEKWRRHTKAEQKMVSMPRNRSRSESSQSSRSSSYNKRPSNKDPATEAISDGEMESDQEDDKLRSKSAASDKQEKDHNISHEDLSDVSDDSDAPDNMDKLAKSKPKTPSPDTKNDISNGNDATSLVSSPKSDNGISDAPKLEKVPQEKTSNIEDGEEQLDFEAEEGECIEPTKTKEQSNGDIETQGARKEDVKAIRRSRGSSLEEGEVSDEAERRPEESEPRPVCRFFSRGACTWGNSCRFLHPGVTDKGNYNMFDVVRGVPPTGPFPAPRDTAPPESAWERGLRTAKEMLRIANKRKEQDMDFEEKKLHLSVGGVVHDPDAELAYAAAAVGASPPHDVPPAHRDPEMYNRPGPFGAMIYRGGRFPRPPMDERERYYERERGFERERPYERPPYYDEHMPAPEDVPYHKRRVRSSREVIVQRAEVEKREAREGREGREVREGRVREIRDSREIRDGRDGREGRDGRGDEWADPWMRAEPAARRRKPQSSEDSYSSSSSSNSSSRSTGSPGARRKTRASSSSRQRLSPSVIVRERRLATARATAMNPPAPRRRAPSPAAARQMSANPPPPVLHRHKEELDPYGRGKESSRSRNRKKYSRSSSSGSESSTSSSESESESRSSSSSGSSGARRARQARLLNAAARPRMNVKSNAGLAASVSTATSKKEPSIEKELINKKRSATSPVGGAAPAKKSVSRREELLKQLKAVEDAIARKRSKI
ncbi:zinc finger CCCH domain-containing protein 18 isoform X1 [Pararge aegeria]|uniref:zinc finger CCCH domain-containing protein 18 isoform X1 n=1 Tax=Pararge aegeria TaxID=116150 RepID=UPI0019D24BA7|nr:zinc finger CCCH domain-containing protein 18 isoform X1 [Pararge aegeria]XP_039755922.1 zinc finger CCCH domain-containing protein 18 isoform X1 [Pararge aegeria]